MFAAVEGKDSHRWWCWVFVGPDTTVFQIAPSRSLKVLVEHLGIEVDDDTGAAHPCVLLDVREPLGEWCHAWGYARREEVVAPTGSPGDVPVRRIRG